MDKPLQGATAGADGYLQVALDNMPGALVYTDDDLNIVFCNDRFREMYPVPAELLRPGQPYPQFLRHLATHGYYGKGDVDMMVARRVESLRHPTGKSFEDTTPDGRCYRIYRRKAAGGDHGDDRRHAGEADGAGAGEQGSRIPPGAR
jgi:PAS domain-containing protein